VFRLAELPVNCSRRDLDQRLKMLEMANQLEGMIVPPGPVSVALVEGGNRYDELKEALANVRDPLHRLFHEFFWYWPPGYSGEEDVGWDELLADQASDAQISWQDNTSLYALHNLALSRTLDALNDDENLEHWQDAMSCWVATLNHPNLDECLMKRVLDLDDARFTASALPGLNAELPQLVASMIAERIVLNAASESDQVSNMRNLLAAQLGADVQDISLQRASNKHQQRLRFLRSAYDKDVDQDILATPKLTDAYVKNCIDELNILERVFGEGDAFFVSVADGITDSLLVSQVAYDKHTQDWSAGISMLNQGLHIVRSDVERKRMQDNINVLTEQLEADNDWTCAGYFDLAKPIHERFERARAQAYTQGQEAALHQLRDILIDARSEQDPLPIRRCVRHCMAYTFRRYAISIWNAAIEEQQVDFDRIANNIIAGRLSSSLSGLVQMSEFNLMSFRSALDGYDIQPSDVNCHICGTDIYGEYITRTLEGNTYSLCKGCDGKVKAQFSDAESTFAAAGNNSLELQQLAHALNPQNRHSEREMATIEHSDTKMHPRSVVEVALDWQLLDMDSVLDLLVRVYEADQGRAREPLLIIASLSVKEAATLFAHFDTILSELNSQDQESAAHELFARLVANGDLGREEVLRKLLKHSKLSPMFARYCLGNGEGDAFKYWLRAYANHADVFSLLEKFSYVKQYYPASHEIVTKSADACIVELRHHARSANHDNVLSSQEMRTYLQKAAKLDGTFHLAAFQNILLGQLTEPGRALRGLEYMIKTLGESAVITLLDNTANGLPKDITPKHVANLLCACVFIDNENVQCAALAVAPLELLTRQFTELIVIAMGTSSEKVHGLCIKSIKQNKKVSAQALLEALCSDNERRRKHIIELLNNQGNDSWVPSLKVLMPMALTIPYEETSRFCMELIRQHHSNWPQGEDVTEFLSWIKHTSLEDEPISREAAKSLQRDFKKSRLLARFTIMFVDAKPPPPYGGEAWWSLSRKKPSKKQQQKLPAGITPPSSSDSKCPCGSGKRYENCHGLH